MLAHVCCGSRSSGERVDQAPYMRVPSSDLFSTYTSSMQPFIYNSLPARVVFGFGTLSSIGAEVERLGCKKALVLTTINQANTGEEVKTLLGPLACGLYSNATMHTPSDVTKEALAVVKKLGADCVVSVGGGSTIGLGKAIALNTDLPQIVVPTTYAGSEATPIIGQTENGKKTTQNTRKVLPEVILYDVDLTMSLPAQMTITSGMNAIAHAVEGLYSKDSNPLINALAEQGIACIARALPKIHKNPTDKDARSDALYGAWACGTTLGSVGMGLHHKLCHVLGGSFNLPHAETHTIILPHAAAYNAGSAQSAMKITSRALGVDGTDAPSALFDLIKATGVPSSLKELGFKEENIEKAVEIALQQQYPNPRPLERDGLIKLVTDAYHGTRPSTESKL